VERAELVRAMRLEQEDFVGYALSNQPLWRPGWVEGEGRRMRGTNDWKKGGRQKRRELY
jgi:hypothetical protein